MFSAATKTGSQPSASFNYIEDVFSTYLYTGTGASQTITNNIDLSGKGGLTWIKNRSNTTGHRFTDTVRGTTKSLASNSTAAEATESTGLTAFNSTGFTIGADVDYNTDTENYVSWSFRKQPKFFDVVTYTGDGTSGRTVSHSLGSVPGMMIVKRTDTAADWQVYSIGANATYGDPEQVFLVLNKTQAENFDASRWNNTRPTSTVFTLGNNATVNASGGTYVAYLFAHNAGGFGTTGTDNVISCGSYAGTGSNININLGYEPQYVMVKCATAAVGWYVIDVMRGASNTGCVSLSPNTSSAENDFTNSVIIPTATGFTVTNYSGAINAAGYDWIYMAIRRPMKVPTDATTVFKPVARAGTSDVASITGLGFAPDSMLTKNRGSGGSVDWSFNFFDRLRSGGNGYRLSTAYTNAENTSINFLTEMGSDGVSFPSIGYTATNGDGYNYINYMFARRPGFFDEVCYTGNGTTQTVTHNLGVAPELVIVKQRNATGSWYVWAKPVTSPNSNWWRNYGYLNNTSVFADWGDNTGINSAPTSTTITYGGWSDVNGSGNTFVNYLFATCPGVSKVGSYTGNGTTQAISCGFTGGARFVLIKPTNADNGWYVYDTARGMTTLTDPYLRLNSTAAESATLGSVTTTAGGFTVNAAIFAAINTNAVSYLFLAIA